MENTISESVFIFNACTKSSSSTIYLVKLSDNSALGSYLVDKNGRTLYYFSNDFQGRNTCAGGCEAIWPYFYAGTLTMDNIGPGFSTTNAFGKVQLTYNGWPLYYFGQDNTTKGNNKGVSVPSPSVWPVAVKDLSPAPKP